MDTIKKKYSYCLCCSKLRIINYGILMPTILLIEDDAVLRGGLTELFMREGYSVISAGCVKEAWKGFRRPARALLRKVIQQK